MKKFYLTIIAISLISCCIAQNNCLVANYPFDGNAHDTSGNGYNGTVYGATLATDRFGNANHAYSFDGSGNYIEAYTLPLLNVRFSYCAWIKVLDNGGNDKNNNFGCYGTDNYGVSTWDVAYNVMYKRFAIFDLTNNVLNTTIDIGTQWTFVVVVYDSTKRYLYVNNHMLNQGNITTPISLNGSSTNLRIGAHLNGAQQEFEGIIDDIRVYKCALTPAEIDSLYNLPPVGINEISYSHEITLYPNPTACKFTISLSHGMHNVLVKIVNTFGEVIYQSVITNPKSDINLDNATPGIYFIQVKDEDRQYVQKLVIQ